MKASIAATFNSILGVTVLLVVLANASPLAEPYVPSTIALQSRRIQDSELVSPKHRRRRRSGLASQLQRRAEEKSGAKNVALPDYFNGTDLQYDPFGIS